MEKKPLWCHLSSHGMMYVHYIHFCAQQNQLMYYFLIAHAEKAILHNRNPMAAIRFLIFVINSLLASKRILQIRTTTTTTTTECNTMCSAINTH
jgi:hypothetical protein